MTTVMRPLAEINQQALKILFREMGVVDTLRFLNQYTTGYGNYTEEREALFADMTLDNVFDAMEQRRQQPPV